MPWHSIFNKKLLLNHKMLNAVMVVFLISGTFVPTSESILLIEGDQEVLAIYHPVNIRLMTFNIRHAKGLDGQVNLQAIIEEIREINPDIVSLQEVDRYHIRSGFVDQIKVIGNELGMSWVYAPSIQLGWIQYGNAILSKYPIVHSEIYILPGRREQRSILKAEMIVNGERVHVYNTHLGVTEKERERQVALLFKLLEKTELPSIVMGDFNMEIDHPLMKPFTNQWQKVFPGSSTVIGGKEIDHIFYKPSESATNAWPISISAWTIPTTTSDHHPVIADMSWGAQLK